MSTPEFGHPTHTMLIGALLRYPARAVQRRLIEGLNGAGFDDLRQPHMAVLQYPGPDGVRPSVLAERAGMSKQAMNQLLMSLERLGYITREDAPEGGRARVVRFTERGHAAWVLIHVLLLEVEDEWREVLGEQRFAELKEILADVWQSPLVRDAGGEKPRRAMDESYGAWSGRPFDGEEYAEHLRRVLGRRVDP